MCVYGVCPRSLVVLGGGAGGGGGRADGSSWQRGVVMVYWKLKVGMYESTDHLRRPGLCSPRLNTPLPLIPFLLLCYLAHVMTKTVSSMHLSSESKQQTRLDLGEVVRFKSSGSRASVPLYHSRSLSLPFSLKVYFFQLGWKGGNQIRRGRERSPSVWDILDETDSDLADHLPEGRMPFLFYPGTRRFSF